MTREELKNLNMKQLKAKAKELKLTSYSRLKEDDLIDLILSAIADVKSEEDIDELLDGPNDEQTENIDTDIDSGDEDQDDENIPGNDEDLDPVEDEVLDDEIDGETESPVTFKKLIKGAFGFNGQTFRGTSFELTSEEAKHKKIQNAIANGLIKIK